MSLDCDWSRCDEKARNADSGEKQAMCFTLMYVDLNRITEGTFPEYMRRIRLWEGLHGPAMGGERMKVEYARLWIGLHSNVSTMSKALFLNKLYAGAERMVKDELRPRPEPAEVQPVDGLTGRW